MTESANKVQFKWADTDYEITFGDWSEFVKNAGFIDRENSNRFVIYINGDYDKNPKYRGKKIGRQFCLEIILNNGKSNWKEEKDFKYVYVICQNNVEDENSEVQNQEIKDKISMGYYPISISELK
jgi:hypothetical protein